MKKFIALLFAALFASVLGAAENKIYFDNFEYPLTRTHWLKITPHTGAWTQEWQVPASGVRWRLRYNGDRSAFKTLSVVNSQGKQIFLDEACKKATWINFTGNDTYTIKAAGNPHTKVSYLVLDTYALEDKTQPGWRSTYMPSWRFLRVKHEAAKDGGTTLTPNGVAPSLYTLLSGLTKKYRAEFTVISPVAQKVKVDAAWQRKTGKGRDRVNQVVEVAPNKPSTVSVEFVPTATPVAVTLLIEKELTVKNFNLFEVK